MCLGMTLDESLSVLQSRFAYARTPAAVPILIMNVRINNANATIMTVILRMKEEDDDDKDVQPYYRGINFKKGSKLLRFSGPASLSC